MGVRGAQDRLRRALSGWGDVVVARHRFGGVEFRLGRRELGHIHGEDRVDIPFPKSVRNDLISAGEAEPHHVFPDTGWVSVFLRTEEDTNRAIRVLERSFTLAVAHRSRRDALAKSNRHLRPTLKPSTSSPESEASSHFGGGG